jgi:hypothetical protein
MKIRLDNAHGFHTCACQTDLETGGGHFPGGFFRFFQTRNYWNQTQRQKMKRRTRKVINSFIADGLFRGQPPQFMQLITSLARQADAADREHRD